MSWTGALAALHADLVTAAAAVTPVIPLVRHGAPDALTQDTIWYAASGRRSSRTGGNTFGKVNIERGVAVTALLRGSTRAGALDATLEGRLVALDEAMLTAIWADIYLGTHAIGIDVDDAEYSWDNIAGQLARSIVYTVWVDLAEVADISI